MWNMYDVYFYVFFVLVMFFLKLEFSIQRDFVVVVMLYDFIKVKIFSGG